MARRRIPWRMEDFRGEDSVTSPTDQDVFGRQHGARLALARGYHWIGQGRARKRYGYKRLITAAVSGGAGQGLFHRRVNGTSTLIAVANGEVKAYNEGAGTWTDLTAGTPTAGANVRSRWGRFNDGATAWTLHCNGTDQPWLWDGNTANDIQYISAIDGAAPTEAVGFTSFHGHPMILTPYDLHYSDYGSIRSFSTGGKIATTRDSRAIALELASRDVLWIFYEDEIYRVEFQPPGAMSTWRSLPVEGSEPCVSPSSIITKDGATYYAADRGIHRLRKINGPSEFVGHRIQTFWDECNRSRKAQVQAISRGDPWNEVMWLVSHGTSTTHNAVLVYNTVLDAWSIFPVALTSGKMEFNAGANFIDTNGIPRTICIDYSGVAWQCWGHAAADSGYTDDGAPVKTTFGLGWLNYGWSGITYTRQMIVDGEFPTDKTFTLTAEPMGKNPITKIFPIGAGGKLLDVDFILDESVLSTSTISQAQTKLVTDARYLQVTLEEQNEDVPHVISSVDFPHRRGGLRMVA